MRRLPRRLPLPGIRLSRRFVAGTLVGLALLIPAWFGLRGSALVRVDEVNVTGLSGPQATQVRQALEDAARRMTTLNVDTAKLDEAVRQYPVVAGLEVDAHLLHALDIHVKQHIAVGALANGDRRMAVAGDGTILEGTLTKDLPLVPVSATPGGRTLAEPDALRMVALLDAAPEDLRSRISRVELADQGLVAHVSDGPELYFGPASRLSAKWAAATRVLGDVASRGAAYLDVRVPERPAAGGLEPTDTAVGTTELQPEVETPQ